MAGAPILPTLHPRGAPYDQVIAHRRRARAFAWCLFLLFVAGVAGARYLRL
jgi:hypothetical protein